MNNPWKNLNELKDGRWVEGLRIDNTIVRCHFAQDLSGKERPKYSGYFTWGGFYWDPFEATVRLERYAQVFISSWRELVTEPLNFGDIITPIVDLGGFAKAGEPLILKSSNWKRALTVKKDNTYASLFITSLDALFKKFSPNEHTNQNPRIS